MQRYFYLFILFLALAIPVMATSDHSYIDEREDWNFIFSHFDSGIERKGKVMQEIKAMVDDKIKRFDKECLMVEKRAGELTFLLWHQSGNEVFGISLYCKQIADLKTVFDRHVSQVNYFKNSLNITVERLKRQEDALRKVDPKIGGEAQTRCLNELIAQQKQISEYINAYDLRLKKANAIQQQLDQLNRESESRRTLVMETVIFSSQDNFFSLFKTAGLLFRLWQVDVGRWLAVQIPDDPEFWRNFLIMSLFVWIPLFFMGRFLFVWSLRWLDFPEKYTKSRSFMVAWGVMIAALICFSTRYMLGEVESAPFYRFGEFLFAFSCMTMALGIRLDRKTMKSCLLLYSPLIAQHVAGIVLCTLLIPYLPLILLTPVLNLPVIVLTLWLLRRQKCPVIDQVLSWLTVFFGVVTMVLAMIGLAYISFTIMLFWFIAVAGIQAGFSLTRLVKEYTERNSHRKIIICLLLTLLIPMLWVFIIGGMIYWMAGLYSQQELLRHFLFVNFLSAKNVIEISLIGILTALFTAMLLRFFLATTRHMVSMIYSEKAEMGLIPTFMTLGTYLAWGGYLLFVLLLFNVHYSSILVVLGGMSMGVGFGLKEIVENFISGVILLAGKQLRPGDVIEFNGIWGKVRKVSVRATVVDTDDNSVVSFPNSQVLSKDFRNWTLNNSVMRLQFEIGVAYGSDVQKVIKLLREIIDDAHYVMKNPKADIFFADFGGSALTFRIRIWTSVNNRNSAPSELRIVIEKVFAENGIVIAFPQLDIHLDRPVMDALAMR